MMKPFMIGTACLALMACGDEPVAEADAPNVTPEAEMSKTATAPDTPALRYPETTTVDVVDDFHGTEVADSYRWLEDDVRESADVAAWVDAQNAVTDAYLETLPLRNKIQAQLTELWDYEKFSLPAKAGEYYFFRRNDGLQNQSVFYVQQGLDAEPRALIDPNEWADDGATALAGTAPSPTGELVAFSIQDGGSDWRTVQVLNTETGEILDDTIEWVKFSGLAWHPDGSGFYYSRFPEPEEGAAFQSLNYNQALYFHEVGTDQSEDAEVYARPDNKEIGVSGYVAADRYLVITMSIGTDDAYEVAVLDLSDEGAEPQVILEGFEHDLSIIGAVDRTLYARTNRGASKGQIVAIDLEADMADEWASIVPEAENVITDASLIGGKLIAEYLEDVQTAVYSFALDGSDKAAIALPGIGAAGGFEGEADDAETFFTFSSFNVPTTIYRLDVATGERTVFKEPEVAFDPDDYEVRQVFYPSKDGKMIPAFITHKKSLTTPAPTLLYGYGGFNISLPPSFSITNLEWMNLGGVFVQANLRGGSEYGKEWHDAGRLANKQNVFDDFHAAAEYLIKEGVTSSDQLAIYGRSNGGLLVGAVVNQRPELYSAALPAVGVMDMLRFNMFTAGRYWTDDYGNPSESADDFAVNYAYSPYHNIESGAEYPAILVTTADTDDRVVPGHSFKYTAALQAAETGPAPKLIRIETRAGHGSGKPTDKIIEEYADMWAFIAEHTGLDAAPE